MSKMGSYCSFGHLKHKLWPKEGPGVELSGVELDSRESASFDSRPLEVGNRPEILGCRKRATYCWKALDESYNFASDRITIRALHKKLCALKVPGVPTGGILGLPRGSPGSPGREKPFGCRPLGEAQSIL
jgi:hypothetical protein